MKTYNKFENMFKTQFSLENWKSKYQHNNETPIETFIRVANNLASVEIESLKQFETFKIAMQNDKVFQNYGDKLQSSWAYKFLKVMVNFDDLGFPIGLKCTPGGRITANAGTGLKNATYLNCFINGPVKNATINYNRCNFDKTFNSEINIKTPDDPDDLINIFLSILEFAKVLASGGGIGINISNLRPRGSIIKGSGTLHPGVVSYLEVFDEVSNCIVKGNNDGYIDKIKNYYKDEEYENLVKTLKEVRKGACIAILNCDHVDIEEFIRAKQTAGKLTKFNLTVGIIPGFMEAVLNDKFWELKFNGKVIK